jgi:hypothetical protein
MWYARNEQAIRVGLFFSASTVAGAFGGLLAYGTNDNLYFRQRRQRSQPMKLNLIGVPFPFTISLHTVAISHMVRKRRETSWIPRMLTLGNHQGIKEQNQEQRGMNILQGHSLALLPKHFSFLTPVLFFLFFFLSLTGRTEWAGGMAVDLYHRGHPNNSHLHLSLSLPPRLPRNLNIPYACRTSTDNQTLGRGCWTK